MTTARAISEAIAQARADASRLLGGDADPVLLAWSEREAALDYWLAARNVPTSVMIRALQRVGDASHETPVLDMLAAD